jgi:hypothetical protein
MTRTVLAFAASFALLTACAKAAISVDSSDASEDSAVLDTTETDAATPDATGVDTVVPDVHVEEVTPDVAPDVVPDVVALPCVPTYTGAIPGASLDLSKTPCNFSISASKDGFALPYTVTVTESVMLRDFGNSGKCQAAPGHIYGGISPWERVDGNEQTWCLCDTGMCFSAPPVPFVATVPGKYDVGFGWDGKNWQGPSDTSSPIGAAFPPGQYLFRVKVAGQQQKSDGSVENFYAEATLPIQLTP